MFCRANERLTLARLLALLLITLLLLPSRARAAPLPLTPEEKNMLISAEGVARADAGKGGSLGGADALLARLAAERHAEPVPLLLAAGALPVLERYTYHLSGGCLPDLESYYLENYDNPAVVSRLPYLCAYRSPELMKRFLEDAMAAARRELPFGDQPLTTRRVKAVALVTRSDTLSPAALLPVLREYEAHLFTRVEYSVRRARIADSSASGYYTKEGYGLKLPPRHLLRYGLQRGDKETERLVLRIGKQILAHGGDLHSKDKVDEFAQLVSTIRSREAVALSLRLLAFWDGGRREAVYGECGYDARDAISALIDTYLETDGIVDIDALELEAKQLYCIERTSPSLLTDIGQLSKEKAWLPQDRVLRLIRKNTPGATLRAQALLEPVPNINQVGQRGFPLLVAAALDGNYEMQRHLLVRGASPEVRGGADGTTPLMIVAGRLDESALKSMSLLIAHGADVNAGDRSGTPLHAAARAGSPEAIELLLRHGAKVNAAASSGATPLDLALFRGRRDVIELLKARGGVRGKGPKPQRVPKREYSIADYVASCEWSGLCDRVEHREADRIEVVSPREMRLVYQSGKMLVGTGGESVPERFVVTVKDHAVVSGRLTAQRIVEKRGLTCGLFLLQGGGLCTYLEDGVSCEGWGSGEKRMCP